MDASMVKIHCDLIAQNLHVKVSEFGRENRIVGRMIAPVVFLTDFLIRLINIILTPLENIAMFFVNIAGKCFNEKYKVRDGLFCLKEGVLGLVKIPVNIIDDLFTSTNLFCRILENPVNAFDGRISYNDGYIKLKMFDPSTNFRNIFKLKALPYEELPMFIKRDTAYRLLLEQVNPDYLQRMTGRLVKSTDAGARKIPVPVIVSDEPSSGNADPYESKIPSKRPALTHPLASDSDDLP